MTDGLDVLVIIIFFLFVALLIAIGVALGEQSGAEILCQALVEESNLSGEGVWHDETCYYEGEDGIRYPLVTLIGE